MLLAAFEATICSFDKISSLNAYHNGKQRMKMKLENNCITKALDCVKEKDGIAKHFVLFRFLCRLIGRVKCCNSEWMVLGELESSRTMLLQNIARLAIVT